MEIWIIWLIVASVLIQSKTVFMPYEASSVLSSLGSLKSLFKQ